MARNHIHFSSPPPGVVAFPLAASGAAAAPTLPVLPGLRASADLLLLLDTRAAIAAGIPLFRSANGVVLSPGLGPEGCILPSFFRAVDVRSGRQVWPLPEAAEEEEEEEPVRARSEEGWGGVQLGRDRGLVTDDVVMAASVSAEG